MDLIVDSFDRLGSFDKLVSFDGLDFSNRALFLFQFQNFELLH